MAKRPWLVVGKGPSADSLPDKVDFDTQTSHVITLNHAIRIVPAADLAHMIGVRTLQDEATVEAIADRARYLVMPFHPHTEIGVRPRADFSLENLVAENEVVRFMAGAGRLLTYVLSSAVGIMNVATARLIREPLPLAHSCCTSGEAAFHLLAQAGVKDIATIGVDGGTERAEAFSDLSGDVRTDYGKQFACIERMRQTYGFELRKL